jgi:DNA processing protein
MVVVVESHAAGGSLITAEAAIARGVEVRVVPGPVHSSASAGSNQLLYDGPGPVRNAQDVLDAMGIFLAPRMASGRVRSSSVSRLLRLADGGAPARAAPAPERRAELLSREETNVLDAVGWRPTLLSQVLDRTGFPVGQASRALDALEAKGLVIREQDWWARRAGR